MLETNGPFWGHYIRNVYLPYVGVIQQTVFERLLPTFDSATEEGEQATTDAWERLGQYAGPDVDPADLAEEARQEGVDRYLMIQDARQTLLNLYAVALHHIVEQQQLFLLRRELLPRSKEDQHSLFHRKEFVKRLKVQGIDPTGFASWDELDVLRLVANAVKHADGDSVDELKVKRPLLFVPPIFRQDKHFTRGVAARRMPTSAPQAAGSQRHRQLGGTGCRTLFLTGNYRIAATIFGPRTISRVAT